MLQAVTYTHISGDSIALGDRFSFDLSSETSGAVMALQGYEGRWFPIALDPYRGQLSVPCNEQMNVLPIESETDDDLLFCEFDQKGLHRYIFIVALTDLIDECCKGLISGRSLTTKKLDQIAHVFHGAEPDSFRVYCLNIIFVSSN